MKKVFFMLLTLVSLNCCSKWGASHSKDFNYTGCSAETRASIFYGDEPSLLILKYENGDLHVTRTNSEMDCAIKERGLTCKAYVEKETIRYYVDYEKDGYNADCICPVDELSSFLTGLHEGREYTFYYCGIDRYLAPVTFTFDKGLHEIFDVESLKAY